MNDKISTSQEYLEKARAHADLGFKYVEEGDQEKANTQLELALEDCNRALNLDPDFVHAYYLRASINLGLMEVDKALKDLTLILSLNLPDADLVIFYKFRGDVYMHIQEYEKALNDYREITKILPDDPKTFFGQAEKYAYMANQLSENGNEEEAQKIYQLAITSCNQALNLDPNNVEVFYLRAELFLAVQEDAKAISDLTSILSLDLPKDHLVEVHLKRGDVFFNLKEYNKAFDDYKEMIFHSSNIPNAYFIRSSRYATLGDHYTMDENAEEAQLNYEKSITDSDHALKLDPDFVDAYYLRSRLYAEFREFDKAIADKTQILTKDLLAEDLAAIYNERGDIYFGRKQYIEAFEDYELMIGKLPDNPMPYYIRAQKYASLGDHFVIEDQEEKAQNYYKLGVSDCNRAIQLDLDYSDAYFQRSRLFSALLKIDEALSDLTHILSMGLPEAYLATIYNERGDLYFNREQYKEAFKDYGQMIDLLPEDATVTFVRANRYATLGDQFYGDDQEEKAQINYGLALEDCNKVIDMEPLYLEAHLLQARILFVLDKYDLAISGLSDLIRQDMSDEEKADILNVRGDIQFAKGQYKEAFADYKLMIGWLPDNIQAYAIRANKYAALGDQFLINEERQNAEEQYKAALGDLSQIIKLDKENIDAYLQRSRIFWVLDDFDKAEADLNVIIAIGGPDEFMAYVYGTRGDIAFDKGNYNRAFDNYAEMIRCDSQDDQAFYDRATKYAIYGDQFLMDEEEEKAKEQYRLALADFDEAIKLNEYDVNYYINRNTLYPSLGDWSAMEENSKTLIKLAPDMYHGYIGRGIALSEQNLDKEALDDFSTALKYSTDIIQEEKAEIYFGKAVSYEKMGNFKAAMFNYESVITFSPNDPRGHIGLGNCLISLEDYFEAAEKFEFALKLNETNPMTLNGHALAMIGIGERYLELDEFTKMQDAFERALKDCESSLEFGGDEFYAYYYKGLSLRSLESYAKAIRAFDRAVSIGEKEQLTILPNIYYEKGEASRLNGMDFDFEPDKSKKYLNNAVQTFNQGIDSALKSNDTGEHDNILSLLYASQGLALTELKEFERALQSFQESIKYDPDNLRTFIGKGRTFYFMQDYEKAKNSFIKVKDVVEKNGKVRNTDWLFELESAYIGLGLVYEMNNQKKLADLTFAQGLQKQQQIPEFKRYINQAYIFDTFNTLDKAEEYRLEAWGKAKQSIDANNEIAWMYADKFSDSKEKLEFALECAHQAVKLEKGNNGNSLDTLGWIYFQLDEYEEAEKYLSEAVEKNEYDDVIRFHYEEVREKLSK